MLKLKVPLTLSPGGWGGGRSPIRIANNCCYFCIELNHRADHFTNTLAQYYCKYAHISSLRDGAGAARPPHGGGGEGRPPLPVAGAARHPIWRAKPAIWGGVVTLTGRGGRSPSPLWRAKPTIWGGVVTLTGRGRAKPAPGQKGGRSPPSHMAGKARHMG